MKSINQNSFKPATISRRDFVHSCTIGVIALASGSMIGCLTTKKASVHPGPASRVIPLDQDWLFGGKFNPASLDPHFNDTSF